MQSLQLHKSCTLGVTLSGIKAAEQIQNWTGFTAPPWHKADVRSLESTSRGAQTEPV